MFSTFFSKFVPFTRKSEKNTLEPTRPQMNIWRIYIACLITKIKKTCSQYTRSVPKVMIVIFWAAQKGQERKVGVEAGGGGTQV